MKVGGFTYKVVAGEKKYLDQASCWGETDFNSQVILIDPTSSAERQASTLLHELVHLACADSYFALEDPKYNEDLAKSVGNSLFMIFKDNPKIMEYLLNG